MPYGSPPFAYCPEGFAQRRFPLCLAFIVHIMLWRKNGAGIYGRKNNAIPEHL